MLDRGTLHSSAPPSAGPSPVMTVLREMCEGLCVWGRGSDEGGDTSWAQGGVGLSRKGVGGPNMCRAAGALIMWSVGHALFCGAPVSGPHHLCQAHSGGVGLGSQGVRWGVEV